MVSKASCACLTLLLLVGTQLATSKSVVETFKDDHYNERTLTINKRAANEESKDEEATILPATESSDPEDATPAPAVITTAKPRRQTVSPPTTTAASAETEDDETTTMTQEEAATVKPLGDDKDKPKKSRPNSTVSPMLLNRLKPDEKPGSADLPASNLLPPMPHPQNFNSFFVPPNAAFAPWAFSPVFVPPPSPYDYPHPSGPAFSEPAGGGSSAFAGGFASASASAGAGGSGGSVYTSTSPGGGIQTSFSSSGPFPGASQQSSSNSFIGSRGSFPAAGDDESVAIEVNGPAPAGAPNYGPSGPGYAVSGPGYSASASYSPGYNVNTIRNGPGYGGYNNPPFQDIFQQYFAAIQAQQQAFQQQLQAQIEAQRQAIWDQSNRVDSNFGVPGGSYSNGPQSASASINLGSRGGFQSAQISPASPGIFSRFGESIPAPSGNQYGVFSSSSSSSSTGPDGKQVSHKSATVGVNDNGKISYKTVHDP